MMNLKRLPNPKIMKYLNLIIAIIAGIIILGLFRGALYFSFNLAFRYFNFWISIILLGIPGFWLIFKMVQTAILTIPLMRFRVTNGLPSYVIGAWLMISSARYLFLQEQLIHSYLTFNVFAIMQIVEIASTIFILFKVNRFVDLNKKLTLPSLT